MPASDLNRCDIFNNSNPHHGDQVQPAVMRIRLDRGGILLDGPGLSDGIPIWSFIHQHREERHNCPYSVLYRLRVIRIKQPDDFARLETQLQCYQWKPVSSGSMRLFESSAMSAAGNGYWFP